MKRLTLPLALSFGMSMAVLAPPVLGQEPVVHRGNTEIVFEPASPADIPIDRYKTFDEFTNDHPDVVKMLSHNPRLANNPRFLKKHAELAQFFEQHPDIKDDFLANPGNYLAPM